MFLYFSNYLLKSKAPFGGGVPPPLLHLVFVCTWVYVHKHTWLIKVGLIPQFSYIKMSEALFFVMKILYAHLIFLKKVDFRSLKLPKEVHTTLPCKVFFSLKMWQRKCSSKVNEIKGEKYNLIKILFNVTRFFEDEMSLCMCVSKLAGTTLYWKHYQNI